jgi:putative DNA primase/helicase
VKIDFDDIREQASGKWLSIFRALGIDIDETGKHSPCPACGGKDRFRVDLNVAEKGSYFCSGCSPGFGFDLIMKVMSIDIKEAMESVASIVGQCERNPITKEKKVSPELLRKIFVESSPIQEGDVAHAYLKSRGLSKIPGMLRYTKKCWNPDTKKNEHALLAVFSLPCSKAVTMQRIFLTADGEKLPVDSPKRILPPLEKMTKGAVRLFPLDGPILGIAEGIGTAIAASEDMGFPVWAALSATLLESFEAPKEVSELIIFADNDSNYAGQKAAYTLANRVSIERKIPVKVYVPNGVGFDWLDVLNEQKKII